MSDYLENVLNASGGYAAPVENLESDKKEAPEGYHYMPDGTLMKDSEHSIEDEYALDFSDEDMTLIEELQALDDGEDFDDYDPLLLDGMMLVPEEADLAEALLKIVDKYGKFNDDNTGVWAGYDSAEKNLANAAIGVKCGNCVFFNAPNGCAIIVAEVEDGGLCRFAVLPDGSVTATAGSKPAPKKDQIKGSDKNKKGSAASGKGVKFSKKIEESLSKKAKEHNEDASEGRKTSLGTLKAVYRRGAGAFSTSHRPDQNRNSWAMGRVNAFLKLLKSGKPTNPKYTTDNDLLPASHPRSSKGSASVSETLIAAVDPCWDGYKQVGMKTKNGKRVPNCVPSAATINMLVDQFNSEFGESRQIQKENAYSVAREAVDKYSELSDDELYSAVLWELHAFAEYSTSGSVETEQEFSIHESYLPEGHPATESSLTASAAWVAGAPDLEEMAREAVVVAFSGSSDVIRSLHASTRVNALVSSGLLSSETISQIKELSDKHSKLI